MTDMRISTGSLPLVLLSALILTAEAPSAALAQGGNPPRLERVDPLDPFGEASSERQERAPAQSPGQPSAQSPDQTVAPAVAPVREPAAAQAPGAELSQEPAEAPEAEENAAAAPAEEGAPRPRTDIDALERRLLEQGSAPPREQAPAPPVPGQRVVLRGLDKMTGDLGEAEAAVGETAKLWRLEIDVKACFARLEASQSAAGSAFLQIRDTKNDKLETVFSGWMFAASPALSAMDHPRYDVWVLNCKTS